MGAIAGAAITMGDHMINALTQQTPPRGRGLWKFELIAGLHCRHKVGNHHRGVFL
jgi:hypothetical protein